MIASRRFAFFVAERKLGEPTRAEPNRAEPNRAEPNRAEPTRAEPNRAEPNRAERTLRGLVQPSAAGALNSARRLSGARRVRWAPSGR